MPREPKDVKITTVHVDEPQQAGLIRTGPDTAVPSRFTASIYLQQPELTVSLYVIVDQAGTRPRVVDARLQVDVRASITTTLMRRVLVDQLLKAALDAATVRVEGRPDIHPGAFMATGDPKDQAWVSPPPRSSAHGDAALRDRAREAARIYSDAVMRGSRAPAVAVANEMGYSRAQVARYIRRARELGLLPPLGKPVDKPVSPNNEEQSRGSRE
jgi:hypothetical protein